MALFGKRDVGSLVSDLYENADGMTRQNAIEASNTFLYIARGLKERGFDVVETRLEKDKDFVQGSLQIVPSGHIIARSYEVVSDMKRFLKIPEFSTYGFHPTRLEGPNFPLSNKGHNLKFDDFVRAYRTRNKLKDPLIAEAEGKDPLTYGLITVIMGVNPQKSEEESKGLLDLFKGKKRLNYVVLPLE